MSKVTAIICAYNESATVGAIAETVLACSLIDELIIVDDGSSDGTYEAVQPYAEVNRVTVIHFPVNQGKGKAMAEGILAAHHDVLLFIDADLMNFQESHIKTMLAPIRTGEADMVIGQPTENYYDEHFNPFRILAGQRAMRKQDVLPIVEKIRDSRYGVETILNLYFESEKKRIVFVYLKDLVHPIKFQKLSFIPAVRQYHQATSHIVRSVIDNRFFIKMILRNKLP